VRANLVLREEHDHLAAIALMPDVDMADARDSAIADPRVDSPAPRL
jgi:hypothetical protein